MDAPKEIDVIFRRLDLGTIDRSIARAAIKYLALNSGLETVDASFLAEHVDRLFDEHETTLRHPILLVLRLKSLFELVGKTDHPRVVRQATSGLLVHTLTTMPKP